jgi:hypothetical protein
MKQDCPCCLEVSLTRRHLVLCNLFVTHFQDLFTSTRSSTTLPCGHNVHVHCFTEYARSQPWTRCPLCRKTSLYADGSGFDTIFSFTFAFNRTQHACRMMTAHIDSEIARCNTRSLFFFLVLIRSLFAGRQCPSKFSLCSPAAWRRVAMIAKRCTRCVMPHAWSPLTMQSTTACVRRFLGIRLA